MSCGGERLLRAISVTEHGQQPTVTHGQHRRYPTQRMRGVVPAGGGGQPPGAYVRPASKLDERAAHLGGWPVVVRLAGGGQARRAGPERPVPKPLAEGNAQNTVDHHIRLLDWAYGPN